MYVFHILYILICNVPVYEVLAIYDVICLACYLALVYARNRKKLPPFYNIFNMRLGNSICLKLKFYFALAIRNIHCI